MRHHSRGRCRIILIDNYDSFTYNLYQFLSLRSDDVHVFRNDAVDVGQLAVMAPDAIVISPGPKTPGEAGISKETIRRLGPICPTLGVCLGHQCLNEVFDGVTARAPQPCHGKTSRVFHDGAGLFSGVPQGFIAARYHSLVADRPHVSRELQVTAWTDDGLVMGLRHRVHPLEGVQFHPESFLTEHGHTIFDNFLAGVEAWKRRSLATPARRNRSHV